MIELSSDYRRRTDGLRESLDAESRDAQRALDETVNQLGSAEAKLQWYGRTDRAHLARELEELRRTLASRDHSVAESREEIRELEARVTLLSEPVRTLWNPKNWFEPEQRAARNSVSEVKRDLERARKLGELETARRNQTALSARKLTDELDEFDGFDPSHTRDDIAQLARAIDRKKKRIRQLENRQRLLVSTLEPLLGEIEKIEENLEETESSMRRAKQLEQALAWADDAYERRCVHEECEDEFGTGSPRHALNENATAAKRFNRDMDKLTARMRTELRRAERDVRSLILDGNNLCYVGDRFIGLSVLLRLLPLLRDSYFVTVVFDASIRRMLGKGDTEIRGSLGEGIEVHVVATSQKADETVLDIAGPERTCFVVSNDRFADFPEKAAVKRRRILRHEIVSGRLWIKDLGIEAHISSRA